MLEKVLGEKKEDFASKDPRESKLILILNDDFLSAPATILLSDLLQ